MKKSALVFLCLFLAVLTPLAYAEDPQPTEMTLAEFEATLNYQHGDIDLPDGIATLKLPESFRYLDPEDTERVLVMAWGNPEGDGTLGMLFPSDISPLTEDGWGVIITYEEDGYVSDKDADSIDYEDLLKEMKDGVAEANKEREKLGYESMEFVGWAAKPYYDKESHKLYWAKELSFGENPVHTLNYNVRILGRKGVLVLNAVAGINQVSAIANDMNQVIAFTDFNPGHRYSEYNSKTDKAAAYGLAALVAGGIGAKTGLFAKLIGLLIAAKKFVIVGFIALVGILSRIFKRKEP
ncbi:MAG: DUF2167 domain-containing protein [Proteobacteria bacterium]|nr:DUF2167 domain-containing protein [Pseudomonadota bacterium]